MAGPAHPILEMINGQNQINNANLESYIREQQQKQQQQQKNQQTSNTNNFFNQQQMASNFQRMNSPNNLPLYLQNTQNQQLLQNLNNQIPLGMNQPAAPFVPFINNTGNVFQQQQGSHMSNNNNNFNSHSYNNNNHAQQFNAPIHQLNFYQNNIRLQHQNQQFNNQLFNTIPTDQVQPQASAQQPTQETVNNNVAIDAAVSNNLPPIKHLSSAFRVAMLGLEALPRRIDGTNQVKYRQIPSYSDDGKWLWEISIKLGEI